jgi:hypothetical protein
MKYLSSFLVHSKAGVLDFAAITEKLADSVCGRVVRHISNEDSARIDYVGDRLFVSVAVSSGIVVVKFILGKVRLASAPLNFNGPTSLFALVEIECFGSGRFC